MSASLVGSEMCIRDSFTRVHTPSGLSKRPRGPLGGPTNNVLLAASKLNRSNKRATESMSEQAGKWASK
eukprot:4581421-Alexandrium_andersonii.AAC.1